MAGKTPRDAVIEKCRAAVLAMLRATQGTTRHLHEDIAQEAILAALADKAVAEALACVDAQAATPSQFVTLAKAIAKNKAIDAGESLTAAFGPGHERWAKQGSTFTDVAQDPRSRCSTRRKPR